MIQTINDLYNAIEVHKDSAIEIEHINTIIYISECEISQYYMSDLYRLEQLSRYIGSVCIYTDKYGNLYSRVII
jgi:hypothetical protein